MCIQSRGELKANRDQQKQDSSGGSELYVASGEREHGTEGVDGAEGTERGKQPTNDTG